MGGVIRTVLRVAAIAVQFIPGIGQLARIGIMIGMSLLDRALAPKSPKVSPAQRDRLFSTIDPSTPRKMVLGSTAMATDIRYEEWGGSDQEYLDRIIAVASHKVAAIREIWIEDKLAWSAAGGVTSTYAGYLTVATRLEGSAANTIAINGGAKWGSNRRLTGCAYVHMRFKTTGNSKKAESPFAGSIPQRLTIIGDGAYVYDPRQDSTAGGSGSQRADDQSTWGWSVAAGNNPALQILFYLLGWRINGKLAVGRGIPARRIDMASFIAAANLCDEAVALAAGGSEARYRSAGVISEADAASSALEAMLATCAGTLRDASGRLAIHILHNDLGAPAGSFTDTDILDEFEWTPTLGLDESFNIVRGRYTDPSANALFQLVDYPAVSLASPDGLERIHPFDLAMVQSGSQAQRLAKQELQRAQYQGVFRATFKATAWKVQVGQVITLTFSALGFASKLFRITEQVISMDGRCAMVLREENAAIYAWSMSEAATVVAAAPTVYDPLNSPLIQAVNQSAIIVYSSTFPADAEADTLMIRDGDRHHFRRLTPGLTIHGTATTIHTIAPHFGWADVQDVGIPAAIDAASAAQNAADDAQTDAALALVELDNIASDGLLTPDEKPRVIMDRDVILAEQAGIDAQAAAFAITTERTAYTSAVTALTSYLAGLTSPVLWSDLAGNTTITGAAFRSAFAAVYAARQTLLNEIARVAKVRADLGVANAAAAQVTADAAELIATNAGIDAADAQLRIEKIVDDDVLDKSEKPDVYQKYLILTGEQAGIDAQASAYGITTEKTAYDTAVSALTSYLTGLSPGFSDFNSDTAIARATFNTKFTDVFSTRQVLLNRISELARRAVEGLNADGTVKSGKVVAGSMSADVLNRIVSATTSGVTATDSGVLLLSLPNLPSKPSQGGYVHLLLTCNMRMIVGADFGTELAILYGRLQRSPAGAGSWTELHSWKMGSLSAAKFTADQNNIVGIGAFVDEMGLNCSSATQYIDVPPSDGSYDYRWLASKTPNGTGSTPPETAAAITDNAYGLALSVQVAA